MSKKQRIIQWLNVFLLIINISAFVTFLVMNDSSEPEYDDRFSSDEFLKMELGLTDAQYQEIEVQNNNVFRAYQALLDKKCEINFELIDELSSDNPDTAIMDSLANRIGKLDTGIKKQTIKHFNNLKSICNDEQQVLLNQLLKEMLDAGDACKYCNKRNCSRRDRLNEKK